MAFNNNSTKAKIINVIALFATVVLLSSRNLLLSQGGGGIRLVAANWDDIKEIRDQDFSSGQAFSRQTRYRDPNNGNRLVSFIDRIPLSVIPGRCEAKSSTALFGWERWKKKAIVSEARGGTRITVGFSLTSLGFALKPGEEEAVTCTLEDLDGTPTWTSVNPPVPRSFTFSIVPAARDGVPLPPQLQMIWYGSTSKTAARESDIRREAWSLEMKWVARDVWLVNQLEEIKRGFTVEGSNPALLEFWKQDKYFNITEDEPQRLIWSVPKEDMVTFNVDPGDVNELIFTYSNKMTHQGLDSAGISYQGRRLRFDALGESPLIRMNDGQGRTGQGGPLIIEERCLRFQGAAGCDCTIFSGIASCIPIIALNLVDNTNTFAGDVIGLPKLRDEGFSGSDYFNTYQQDFVATLPQVNPRDPKQILIPLKLNFDFEIWENETVDVDVPLEVIVFREAPLFSTESPGQLIIVPSPGEAIADFRDLAEEDLWIGGIEMNFTMDGESWVQAEVLEHFINDSYATSSSPNSDGWDKYKHELIPSDSSITFPSLTIMTLKFRQNVEFNVDFDEVVHFPVRPTMARSGLPLITVSNNNITISKSQGVMLVNGVAEMDLEEAVILRGELSFNLTLAGEQWNQPQIQNCFNTLIAAGQWKARPAKDVAESSGWDSVREDLFGPGTASLQLLSKRNVQFTQSRPSPTFNILRGQELTLELPSHCTVSKQVPTPPKINILPQNALLTTRFFSRPPASRGFGLEGKAVVSSTIEKEVDFGTRSANDTSSASSNVTKFFDSISETRLRQGALFVVESAMDEFDVLHQGGEKKFKELIYNSLVGRNGIEWNAQKASMIPDIDNNIKVDNRSRIEIILESIAAFDVSVDELVALDIDAEWMQTRRIPINTVEVVIHVSPGLVEVPGWLGSKRDQNYVLEDDIRQGLVFFNFSLLGDSWNRQRAGYVASLSAKTQPDLPLGLARFGPELFPDVDFFGYTYTDGREGLLLRFQAAPDYDIAVDEVGSFTMDPTVVSSRLAPTFSLSDGAESESYDFLIKATPGEIILSGMTRGLNERAMRTRKVKLLLTLFGDTFTPNAATLIRDGLTGSNKASATTFTAVKEQLLDSVQGGGVNTTGPGVIEITFAPTKAYDLSAIERIQIPLIRQMFLSNMLPKGSSLLEIPVLPSGGELSVSVVGAEPELLADGTTLRWAVPEASIVQEGGAAIRLQLDGDEWWESAIRARPVEFLSQLRSQSTIQQEPNGFSAHVTDLLSLYSPNITFITTRIVQLWLCGRCISASKGEDILFNIYSSEELTFSLENPVFIRQSLKEALPTPSRVGFDIAVNPKKIIFEIDEGRLGEALDPKWNRAQSFSVSAFKSAMSYLLTTPQKRIIATEDRTTGVLCTFYFTSPLELTSVGVTVSEAADRRPGELLAETIMILNKSYIDRNFYTAQYYYLENGPPEPTPAPTLARGVTSVSFQTGLGEPWETLIWIGSGLLFLSIIACVIYCTNLHGRGAKLGGKMRLQGERSHRLRPEGHTSPGIAYRPPGEANGGDSKMPTYDLDCYAGQQGTTEDILEAKRKHSESINPLLKEKMFYANATVKTLDQAAEKKRQLKKAHENTISKYGMPNSSILQHLQNTPGVPNPGLIPEKAVAPKEKDPKKNFNPLQRQTQYSFDADI